MNNTTGVISSAVVAFIIVVLLIIAYSVMCCHLWGLHFKILNLIRCLPVSNASSPSHNRRVRYEIEQDEAPTSLLNEIAITPPPSYSEIKTPAPPSYKTALQSLSTTEKLQINNYNKSSPSFIIDKSKMVSEGPKFTGTSAIDDLLNIQKEIGSSMESQRSRLKCVINIVSPEKAQESTKLVAEKSVKEPTRQPDFIEEVRLPQNSNSDSRLNYTYKKSSTNFIASPSVNNRPKIIQKSKLHSKFDFTTTGKNLRPNPKRKNSPSLSPHQIVFNSVPKNVPHQKEALMENLTCYYVQTTYTISPDECYTKFRSFIVSPVVCVPSQPKLTFTLDANNNQKCDGTTVKFDPSYAKLNLINAKLDAEYSEQFCARNNAKLDSNNNTIFDANNNEKHYRNNNA